MYNTVAARKPGMNAENIGGWRLSSMNAQKRRVGHTLNSYDI